MHHSDTYLEPLIPGMIEIGIDICRGRFPRMTLWGCRKGIRPVAFHGGIDIAAIDFAEADEAAIRRRCGGRLIPMGRTAGS